jgi:hypothetical protein
VSHSMAVSQGWSDGATCRFDGKGKILQISGIAHLRL